MSSPNKEKTTRSALEHIREWKNKAELMRSAVDALSKGVKNLTLSTKEIDSKPLYNILQKIDSEIVSDAGSMGNLPPLIKQTKEVVENYSKSHQQFQRKKDREFREVIGMLQRVISDNQKFYSNAYSQNDRIEQIIESDDLNTIKESIKEETSRIRQALKDKEANDEEIAKYITEQVTKIRAELEKAMSESQRDGLTGLYSMNAFEKYITDLFEKQDQADFSLLILDIDDLETIYKKYGKIITDRIILATTHECTTRSSSKEFIARSGDSSFMILMPGFDLKKARIWAKDLCSAIAVSRYSMDDVYEGEYISFTISIGISLRRKNDDMESVIDRAVKALRVSKLSGKNRVTTERSILTAFVKPK